VLIPRGARIAALIHPQSTPSGSPPCSPSDRLGPTGGGSGVVAGVPFGAGTVKRFALLSKRGGPIFVDKELGYPGMVEMEEHFHQIYQRNEWGFGSGVGSLPLNNVEYMKFVESFIARNRLSSVVDLGCGDWQFSRFMNWSSVRYIGMDVVADIVSANRRQFGRERISFEVFQNIEQVPNGDLLLCKDVLQHLSNQTVAEYLPILKQRFRFLLITNDEWPTEPNREIVSGDWRPLRLDFAPFSETAPVVLSWNVTWGGWKPTTKSTALICRSSAV
jgi:SAM-dependent methyltransferase